MTYWQFHLLFNLPLTVLLLVLQPDRPWEMTESLGLFALLIVVYLFTTPWDSWAVREGIWGFPRARVSHWLGALPIEELAFFGWQTINVVLSLRIVLGWEWARSGAETRLETTSLIWCASILGAWLVGVLIQRWKSRRRANRYAWHLLFWFLPLILMQNLLVPEMLFVGWKSVLLVTAFWGIYYTAADLVAVRQGIWFFDEGQITGVKLARVLPWEECAFFFLTSLLVAQSYWLLLPPALR